MNTVGVILNLILYVNKNEVHRKLLKTNQCRSGSKITAFFLANLRICGSRINHYKFADLKFSDWHTSEICRFAIAE
jgi:hypothetical protein